MIAVVARARGERLSAVRERGRERERESGV